MINPRTDIEIMEDIQYNKNKLSQLHKTLEIYKTSLATAENNLIRLNKELTDYLQNNEEFNKEKVEE